MPAPRSLRARGLQSKLVAGVAVLVIGCGGFLAYRAIAAMQDAYHWTAEAEAATVARGFAQSLGPRDLRSIERLRARAARLGGVHPDLTGASVAAAGAATPRGARYRQVGDRAELVHPLVDDHGRPRAVLTLGFALGERAELSAAARRDVLL